MAKVVVAQCKDPRKWEEGFRTHGDLFRSQTVTRPIGYGVNGNEVAVCLETAEAMEFDGLFARHRKDVRFGP
jgi:hypothetical protein